MVGLGALVTVPWPQIDDDVDVALDLFTCTWQYVEGGGRTFDSLVIDEVQDFMPVMLLAVCQLCTHLEGVCLAGDTCQTINPGAAFSFRCSGRKAVIAFCMWKSGQRKRDKKYSDVCDTFAHLLFKKPYAPPALPTVGDQGDCGKQDQVRQRQQKETTWLE